MFRETDKEGKKAQNVTCKITTVCIHVHSMTENAGGLCGNVL